MDFGYLNLAPIKVRAIVESGPVAVEIPLLATADGFEILRKCPLSFNQLSPEQFKALGQDKEIALRREEHRWLIAKLATLAPEAFRPILPRIPYFDLLGLVDQLMRGEREPSEADVIRDYGQDSAQHALWKLLHPAPPEKKTPEAEPSPAK